MRALVEGRAGGGSRHRDRVLPAMLLTVILLTLIQAAIGMMVNLFVAIPRRHPGAEPSNYLAGSFHSVVWAVAHGPLALALHASLGAALIIVAVGAVVHAVRAGDRAVAIWSGLGALFVVGAGFNGASYLDFADKISSLIMALLAFGAAAAFSIALYLKG